VVDAGVTGVNYSIAVLKPGSNSTVYSIPIPQCLEFGVLTVDIKGAYAYSLYIGGNSSQPLVVIEQYDLSAQRTSRTLTYPLAQYSPAQTLAAGPQSGEVYWIDTTSGNVVDVTGQGGMSTFHVGQYPTLSLPSDVAVTPRERNVLVACNMPFHVVELNATGQLVMSYPIIDEFSQCVLVPYLNVAVDVTGAVYMPICNGSILIWGPAMRLIGVIPVGNGSIPRAVAAGPFGSVFVTDDSNKREVVHLSRNGTILGSFQSPHSGSWLFDVDFDYRTDSIWVTDLALNSLFHWAVNGTMLGVYNLTLNDAVPLLPYAIAIDHTHDRLIVSADTNVGEALVVWMDMEGHPLYNYTFSVPVATGMTVTPDGNVVYATDMYRQAVLVFQQTMDDGIEEEVGGEGKVAVVGVAAA